MHALQLLLRGAAPFGIKQAHQTHHQSLMSARTLITHLWDAQLCCRLICIGT